MGSLMRSDANVAGAGARFIRAVGRRCADGDPEAVVHLRRLRAALEAAEADAILGWHEQGITDRRIGEALGVTQQAVNYRRRLLGERCAKIGA
jgi:hypothetical protein